MVIISLFLYSFTQVDLSLTLSQLSIYQTIEKHFQYIGYFQRPLSTEIFILIITLLFILYLSILSLVRRKLISRKQVWLIIIFSSVLLTFSYNAFSYDLFNYIFDAKIVTYYGQNPYLHKALDYSGEPMLSFMRWTHRVYPYGPVWLGLTVPLSFVGFNIFLPTFFLFKALMSISFVGTCYFIGKILRIISPKDEILGLVFFALNPLVLVESLVSSHNDISMLFFAVYALYLFLTKFYIRAFILLVISIGVKFATGFILPVFVGVLVLNKLRRNILTESIILYICTVMVAAVVIASMRTNFQPWYVLYVLPFAALLSQKYYVFIPAIILSFSSLLIYVPFLYLGNWDPPVPAQLFWINCMGIIFSIIFVFTFRLRNLLK